MVTEWSLLDRSGHAPLCYLSTAGHTQQNQINNNFRTVSAGHRRRRRGGDPNCVSYFARKLCVQRPRAS